MECLLSVLTSCLLNPSHVLIRADVHALITHTSFYWTEHGAPYKGPVARVELLAGGDISSSLRIYYGVGHQSFISTHRDSGYEYITAGLEWRPFR